MLTRIIISIYPLGFQFLAPLAQLAEHRTLNPQVLGSSPRGRTTEDEPRFHTTALNAGLSTFKKFHIGSNVQQGTCRLGMTSNEKSTLIVVCNHAF